MLSSLQLEHVMLWSYNALSVIYAYIQEAQNVVSHLETNYALAESDLAGVDTRLSEIESRGQFSLKALLCDIYAELQGDVQVLSRQDLLPAVYDGYIADMRTSEMHKLLVRLVYQMGQMASNIHEKIANM